MQGASLAFLSGLLKMSFWGDLSLFLLLFCFHLWNSYLKAFEMEKLCDSDR